MPPKPSKKSQVSHSDKENHVLSVADAILVDIQRRLEKLDWDKIDNGLINMETDMGTIKQKVFELEGGLSSVNSEVAELKESTEKKAGKEHL